MPKQDNNNNQKTDTDNQTGGSQIPSVPTSNSEPLPPVFGTSSDDVTPPMDADNPSPANTTPQDNGSAAPTDDISSTPMGTTNDNNKKAKKISGGGKGKVIAAIFGILLLLGSVGAGVILVRQNQDIREKAKDSGYRVEYICTKGSQKAWCLDHVVDCPNDSGGPRDCSDTWWDINGWSCGGDEKTEKCSGGGGGGGNSCPEGTVVTCSNPAKIECKATCKFPNKWEPPGPGNGNECGHTKAGDPMYRCEICECLPPTPSPSPSTPPVVGCNKPCTDNSSCNTAVRPLVCVAVGDLNQAGTKLCRNSKCIDQPDCKCPTPTPTPTATPTVPPITQYVCLDINAFDTSWNKLTADQLKQLKAGDVVRFSVRGQTVQTENLITGSQEFNAVRFTINGKESISQTKRPGYPNQIYTEYTIPENTKTFNIKGEVIFLGLD